MTCNVLLVTSFGRPWNNGWFYRAGLEQNGCTVIPFDPSAPQTGQSIADIIKEHNISLVLFTKDELPSRTFRELRGLARVVMWYPDPFIPAWLPDYVRSCDVFLTMAEGLVDEFRKINPNSFWLSQAFEPSYFKITGTTDDERQRYAADVAFVGNLGSKGQYLTRRGSLQKVIDSGCLFKWWGPKMPRKLSTLPLLFGRLGRSYGGAFVWGETYAKVAQLSKIFLAFDSMPHVRKSMSARMYTAVGCGAFYLCRHVEGIEDVLVPDREIVTFRTEDEMIEKIRFYLSREDLRKVISERGRNRVLREHTYEVRIRQMLAVIDKVFGGDRL